MNLSGNKVIAASALFLAINLANAEAPNLVEFTSGTAAKAAEVNSNFDELKTYSASLEEVIETQAALIAALEAKATTADTERTALEEKAAEANSNFNGLENVTEAQAVLIAALETKATAADTERAALEDKVSALETEGADLQSQISELGGGDEYTIPVTGDGEIIGLTKAFQFSTQKPFIPLKTEHGMVAISGTKTTGNFDLRNYDMLRDERTDPSYIRYSDSNCTQPILALSKDDGDFIFTKVVNVIDSDRLIITDEAVYKLVAGTVLNNSTSTVYDTSSGTCDEVEWYQTGSIVIPLETVTADTHDGLKKQYDTIEIEGYAANPFGE